MLSANDAMMTISSAGIVTFKDDILIKDGGTLIVASAATAITIASTGIVTFVDDIIIKDAGTIGSASTQMLFRFHLAVWLVFLLPRLTLTHLMVR